MQAVHEMLLQSWHGTIRIFPAVSERWRDVSFENLRAEGGWIVSAKREQGQMTQVSITASKSGIAQILDPFNGRGQWSREGRSDGTLIRFSFNDGDVVTGRLP